MLQTHENEAWVNFNFQGVELGDERREKRLKKVVSKMLHCPEASIPKQMESWSDTKAAYSLFSCSNVTFNRVQSPHRKKTKKLASESTQPVLFIEDTTELDFTDHPETEGLGPIGNHNGRGLMMHTCLAVEYNKENPRVLGIPMQQLWKRREKPHVKNETRTERNNRHTEAKIWSTTLRRIGNPPAGNKWVEVGDRANDIFEFMDHCRRTNWDYVVRVSQNRNITVDEELTQVEQKVVLLPEMGTTTITIRRGSDTKNKKVELKISYQEIEVIPPQRFKGKIEACKVWIIRAWNDEEDIDWRLYSSLPVTSLEEAVEKLEWYACRWIIEEYHKCLKTGCKVQDRQLETEEALKTLVGIFAIIAVKLLEIRDQSRMKEDQPAHLMVPEVLVKIICKKYSAEYQDLTIRKFWRNVARLGGFLGRKSDGDPGWQTLWKGWLRLMDMSVGAELILSIV